MMERSELKKAYRWCFVPLCKNTSKSTPDKVFVNVPEDEKRRKKWFEMVRRSDKPTKSVLFCCEDHFNLQEDMANYVKYKIAGGKIILKPDAVPRFFSCHPDRNKRAAPETLRSGYIKYKRQKEIQDIFEEYDNASSADSTSKQPTDVNIVVIAKGKINMRQENDASAIDPSSKHETTNVDRNMIDVQENIDVGQEQDSSILYADSSRMASPSSLPSTSKVSDLKQTHNKVIQVNIRPHYRSVGSTVKPDMRNSQCSPIKNTCEASTSPLKFATNVTQSSDEMSFTKSSSTQEASQSEYEPIPEDDDDLMEDDKKCALNMVLRFIAKNPKSYIGIPTEWLWILDTLHVHTNLDTDNIKLTLMKIKLDYTFERLGDQFGKSGSQASRIFNSTVPILAHALKTLIYFPSKESVKKAMPIAFRTNFSNVESIIDCFEIQIQKPSNSVHQALSWSEYKKGNTVKYLVSSTCDGFINFISCGYAGRVSDIVLFEDCGIIENLPEHCGVMADRGFKQIQSVLNKKNCMLIRPPSVSASTKPTKEEVLLTKSIASLRIHIERVIRRLREFELLVPHATLNHNIMPYIDDVVTIAAALINIQSPIIRT